MVFPILGLFLLARDLVDDRFLFADRRQLHSSSGVLHGVAQSSRRAEDAAIVSTREPAFVVHTLLSFAILYLQGILNHLFDRNFNQSGFTARSKKYRVMLD